MSNAAGQNWRKAVEAAGYVRNQVICEMPRISPWISVEDRLPEQYTAVIVWDGESVGEAYWEGDIFEWVSDGKIAFATHWMPLPEPPNADMRGDSE